MSSTDSSSLVGTRLGPYRIQAILGKGGMGDVYRAVHEKLGRPVAIKTLKTSIASDVTALDRFEKEARAVNAIRHENIVEVTDFAPDGFEPRYMVMELLEGRTLGDAIREVGKLSVARTARIGAQIASAIAAANALDIVHRDLKPDNVFLIRRAGTSDYVKILDFGIARLRRPPGDLTATKSNVLIGTPMYMSPEQAEGVPATAASDVYTLGIMLFQMLTGRLPFKGDSILEVMYAHLKLQPPRVSELSPDVPAPLTALIEAMLAKKAADRPSDMRSVGLSLVAVAGLEAERFGLHERARRPGPKSGPEPTLAPGGTAMAVPARRATSENPADSAADSMWAGATLDSTFARQRVGARRSASEPPDSGERSSDEDSVPVAIPQQTTARQRPAAKQAARAAPTEPPAAASAPAIAGLGSTRSEIMPAVAPPPERDSSATPAPVGSPGADDAGRDARTPGAPPRPVVDATAVDDLGSLDTVAPELARSTESDMAKIASSGERMSAVVAAIPTPLPTRPARPREDGAHTRKKFGLLAAALALVLAVGVTVVLVQGKGASSDGSGLSPSALDGGGNGDDAPSVSRQGLDVAVAMYNEPSAPVDCQTADPQLLQRLAQAAGELSSGAAGSNRDRDRKALALLSTPVADAAEYWYWLGKARLYTGRDRDHVLDASDRALTLCPEYAAAHALSGTARFRAGDTSGAEVAYKRALQLADDFASARYDLALTQLRLDRVEEGIALLDQVIEQRALIPEARLARGQAYLQQGRTELALADLEAATAALPDNADGFYALGVAYLRAGRPRDGQTALCRSGHLGHAKGAEMCAQP